MSGPTTRTRRRRPLPGRSARRHALQRFLRLRRRHRRSGLRQLRPPRGLRPARRPAHRPARQNRPCPLRRQLPRRQGLHRRAARRRRRAHLLRSRRTTATSRATPSPSAPGVRRPACSAAPSSTSSSIPAIRRPPASPPPPTCPTLPASHPDGNQPRIISIPISYHDAAPILKALKGPARLKAGRARCPSATTSGGLGRRGVKVHLVSQQDYQRRIIWDVIGKVKGTEYPDDWVVAGNHRDAWVYGAVDPSSGTAAMLESVHGVGALLRQGWRPKRTIVFCSWDAEEEGLIGSTEWVEQHAKALAARRRLLQHGRRPSPGPISPPPPSPRSSSSSASSPAPFPARWAQPYIDQWSNQHSEANEHRGSNAPPATRKCTSATSAPAPTSRPSSSTWACPPPTSAPAGPTASTTPSSITTPGTPRTPIRTSSICSRWPASSALKLCAWPTPTSCPTTTSPTRRAIAVLHRRRQAQGLRCRRQFARLCSRQGAAGRLTAAAQTAHDLQKRSPPATWPGSTPALRQAETALASTTTAFPIAPGTGTPSMRPASSPATPQLSSPASMRPSTPTTQPAPPSSSPCSPRPSTAPPRRWNPSTERNKL